MGCLVQGDRLNQAGSLELRVMRDGDMTDPDVRPYLPVGPAVYGANFSFSLVFWQVSGLSPEKPLSPTYNFLQSIPPERGQVYWVHGGIPRPRSSLFRRLNDERVVAGRGGGLLPNIAYGDWEYKGSSRRLKHLPRRL